MEDLEEQLRIKNSVEKRLSIDNNQLEMKMTNTRKEVDRMSKNVEALQWRIRNQYDVPVDNLTPETCKQEYLKHLINIPVTENKCKSTISYCAGAVETSQKMSII